MSIENHAAWINLIEFGSREGTDILGRLRQVGPDLWHERGTQDEHDLFEFREVRRSSTSIYLHDTRRDVRLEADLSRNVLRYSQPGQPPVDLYAVRSVSQQSTGWLVNQITFTSPNGASGAFRQTRDYAWQELDSTGKVTFHFIERQRDDWSVYLVDASRGVEIQGDLYRKKVRYRDGNGLDQDIYDILDSSSRVNGWTVRQVAHGSPKKAVNGRFREKSERNWVEEAANGKEIYNFSELLRDDWSVYLEDSVRGIRIQLDLYRNKIRIAAGNEEFVDLYDIVEASAAHIGCSLTAVDAGSLHTTLTRYRQSGPASWEEAVPGQAAGFRFHEVERDARRVRLHDPSRHVDLEIDLKRRKIRYAEHGKSLRDLYDISNCFSGVNGRTVLKVDFKPAEGLAGSYVKTGDTQWAELQPDGSVAFEFDEVQRDDWSVYLRDVHRNVQIQLDLWRRRVGYAAGTDPIRDLYAISGFTSKMTARLVNHVVFNADGKGQVGVFRQTDIEEWVQDGGPDSVAAFTFREIGRDDWSVYLVDDSRGVTVQLDLWRSVILYGDAQTTIRPWYTIASADRLPHLGLKSAEKVNWVVVGDSSTTHASLRQIGPVTWADFDANGQRTSDMLYTEVQRDRWNVYLVDEKTGTKTIRIDLFNDRVFSRNNPAKDEQLIAHVVAARTKLNGWLANTVACNDGQSMLTLFRQTGYVTWIEQHQSDTATYLYDEIARDETSITLHDPDRNVGVVIDLKNRSVTYSGMPNRSALAIARYERKPELWLTARRMTSRSNLTEAMEVVAGTRRSVPVYRSSLSLPQLTTHLDITASEQVDVEIDGQAYTIDAQKPVRIRASLTSKLSISMPANNLQCPAIYVRTNLMQPGERHILMADVDTHNRLATLADGELYNARQQLGIDSSFKKSDVDQIQVALCNIARTAQHTYNQTPHGVQHDRALLPSNMQHPHFKLDFSNGGARYQPLTATEVAAHVAGAERLSPSAAQGFFDIIGNFFKNAASIVVHTIEDVGEKIVDTATHVVNDVVQTVDQVGEDLIHGDLLEAGKDLIQGGEHAGGDLVKGVLGVGGAVVKGASQLLVVTLDDGKKLVQYVINHTGFIGKAIGWLLEKAGATLGNAVRWLLSPLGWDDILLVHDTLRDAVNNRLDGLKGYAQEIKAQSDKFFQDLSNTISTDVENLVHQVSADRFQTNRPSTAQHSGAIEKVEWLVSKLFQYSHEPNPLATVLVANGGGGSGPLAPLEKLLSDELGSGGSKVREAFEDSLDQLVAVFTDNSSGPEHLLAAVLEIAKGVALLGLDIVAKIIDLVLDLLSDLAVGLKELLNTPMDVPIMSDFYKGLTDGRPMTVLSIASLLLATPVTLIHKALTNTRPFASGPALALTDLSDEVKAIGNTYGSVHILMSILGPIAAGVTAVNTALDQGIFGEDPATNASPSPVANVVRFISVALSITAQVTANPIVPTQPYSMPSIGTKNDVVLAPTYWSHVIWHCQSGFLIFNTIATVGVVVAERGQVKLTKLGSAGDLISGTTAAWGVVHIALMGVLDQADRKKGEVLKMAFADSASLSNDAIISKVDISNVPSDRPTTDEAKKQFVADLRNYYEWSQDTSPGRPIPNKGFGNVMDGLPEVGQLFAAPSIVEGTEGLSLLGTALAEFIGHLSEGATYLARTAKNELL